MKISFFKVKYFVSHFGFIALSYVYPISNFMSVNSYV